MLEPLWHSEWGKEGGACPGPTPSLPAPHLLHDEVVEECHHAHVEGLHPLLPEEAPEDLEAAQLEELLLGVGEVPQQGGQRKESLEEREGHQHAGHVPLARLLFMAAHGDRRNTLQPICAQRRGRCI